MSELDAADGKLCVLVVEDNPITRKLMRVTLEMAGYRVVEAEDANQAIALLPLERPAVVLQDDVLPDATGRELLARIRATDHGRTVMVVLLTSPDDALRENDDYGAILLKPVESSRLIETVGALLALGPGGTSSRQTPSQRILVVDDEPTNIALARAWLSPVGFDVIGARSAQEAIEVLRRERPDAILADVLMPEQDGFQLCATIRRDPFLAGIPIVLVSSAYTDERDHDLARDAGAFELVIRSPTLVREGAALRQAIAAGVDGTARLGQLNASEYVESMRRQLDRQTEANRNLVQRSAIQSAALSLIGALSHALAEPQNLTAVIGEVLVQFLDASGLAVGILYLQRPDGTLVLSSSCGLDQSRRARAEIAFGSAEMISGAKGEGVPLALTRGTATIAAEVALLDELGRRSVLIVPLARLGDFVGTLVLASDLHNLSDLAWIAFGRTLAAQFTQAIALARALSELSTSQDRYRQLFHAEPIPMFLCNSRTLAIIDVNEAAVHRYSYSRHELLSLRMHDLHPAADQRRMEASLIARAGRPSRTGEWRHQAKGGAIFEVELICTPLSGELQQQLLVAAYDISERKRAEALFRAAVEVSPNGLIMIDRAGTILMINRQIEAMFGYAESELIGRPMEILLPSSILAAHEAHRESFFERPLPRRMGTARDLYGIHKGGYRVPVEVGLAPTTRGDETLVLASVIDITERHRAEESIREAAARWHALMESATDGVSIISPDGVMLETNRRMAAILGRTAEDTIGRHIGDFPRAGNSAENLSRFADVVAAGSGRAEGVELDRPDGTFAIVDFALSTMEFGGQPAILSIGRDVTEQRMLERQYRQAQKMEAVGRLAGGVAHDFNNLLTAIIGYSELLAADVKPDSTASSDIKEILKAADRAAELTKQLLSFSRQLVLAPRVLSLNSVVENVEKMLQRVIGEDIELTTKLAADAGNVRADAGQLEQVLMNLAVNARDAMPTGGAITIETTNVQVSEEYTSSHQPISAGPYVMLAVSDTGVGMTDEVRARIFEPFFTTKEPGKGTGLGLATAYGIVKQSGGFIWAYGEPGMGATFKIYLPLIHEPTDVVPAAPLAARDLRGTETVLLVEDDNLLRPLARTVLTRYGYTVLEAPNAAVAMAVLHAHPEPIHLLLTDMVMPGESGMELSQRVIGERPYIKVLFMSGYTDEAVLRHGQLQSRTALLQKPFTPEVLARLVKEILSS